MPEYGLRSKNVTIAFEMLEHCRFIYKIYSQTLMYPMDPFYESHTEEGDSARERLFTMIHQESHSSDESAKFDPIQYRLDATPNPHKSIVYRLDEKQQHVLWQPRALDLSIAYAKGFKRDGKAVDNGAQLQNAPNRTLRCTFFQGRTGMTVNHPNAGWPSWFGSVIYNPANRRVIITFRGSRSGAGKRAAVSAQFSSKGNPDWVTDMNHLKSHHVHEYHNAKFAAGFFFAYESCKKSLKAAFKDAVNGAVPSEIVVTGHSLGGALAQNCYVDLKIGTLGETLDVRGREDQIPVFCYAISAPPIIHGRKAHEALALRVDASQIFHYFCPKDNVHESELIDPNASKHGLASFLHGTTHPQTHPHHLGVEIGVRNTVDFPDAHEPVEVWKGLNDGTAPETAYWPLFKFDPLVENPANAITEFQNQGLMNDLRAALRDSITTQMAQQRAREWARVIKNEDARGQYSRDLNDYERALQIIGQLRQVPNGTGNLVQGLRRRLQELRAQLIRSCKDASGRASGAAYWSLLQGLTVEQLLM